jgi:hypothetical protein
VSAGRSSTAILLAAVALAGCATHEPDTRPFHLSVEVDGTPIAQFFESDQLLWFSGTVLLEDDVNLLVQDAILDDGNGTPLGDVHIGFDRSALPDLAFPALLAGEVVTVALRVSPTLLGPTLEPLPVPGIRIITGGATPVSQFLVWEGTYLRERGARVLSPAGISEADPALDFPVFFVEEQYIESEPGECGLVYYDNLIVGSPAPGITKIEAVLRRERTEFAVDSGSPAWIVAHVVSWHRDGACSDQSRAWTQFAAWRAPPPPP